jgi:hypothetical protein
MLSTGIRRVLASTTPLLHATHRPLSSSSTPGTTTPSPSATGTGSAATTSPLRGVLAPVLVPVEKDYKPDMARLVDRSNWLLDNGCHGLVLYYSNSPSNNITCLMQHSHDMI